MSASTLFAPLCSEWRVCSLCSTATEGDIQCVSHGAASLAVITNVNFRLKDLVLMGDPTSTGIPITNPNPTGEKMSIFTYITLADNYDTFQL